MGLESKLGPLLVCRSVLNCALVIDSRLLVYASWCNGKVAFTRARQSYMGKVLLTACR
jgi:hypothetical protein